MRWFLRGSLMFAALGLTVVTVGCAEDNEKTANITGVAPENAPKTQAERYNQMKGAGGGLQTNYPGAAKRGATTPPPAKGGEAAKGGAPDTK